jgi:hypothetical protein
MTARGRDVVEVLVRLTDDALSTASAAGTPRSSSIARAKSAGSSAAGSAAPPEVSVARTT